MYTDSFTGVNKETVLSALQDTLKAKTLSVARVKLMVAYASMSTLTYTATGKLYSRVIEANAHARYAMESDLRNDFNAYVLRAYKILKEAD